MLFYTVVLFVVFAIGSVFRKIFGKSAAVLDTVVKIAQGQKR